MDRISKVVGFWDSVLGIDVLPYTPWEFARKKKEIGIVRIAVEEGLTLL